MSSPARHQPPGRTNPPLVERLGYPPGSRVIVVACGELGSSHSATVATYMALRAGTATTADLMIPCPWSRYAAAAYRGEDVGVSLTLLSEHDLYRWGPVTRAPSLLDGDGGFPRTLGDMWEHADPEEVGRECRAQIERAILWGFDVSHLSAHMDALLFRPELFDVYLELASELSLPIRLGSPPDERSAGFPFRRLASDGGVVFPDRVVRLAGAQPARSLERAIFDLPPGVTELVFRPALDTEELRSLTRDWPPMVEAHDLLSRNSPMRALVERSGSILAGYRELRAVMRAG
ncbi:MAG: ChbG/HpnK family deacetylase [Acidimicrobiales bacterium]